MQNKKKARRKPPVVQSISRAGRILGCLGGGFNTITEIARECGLSKSTVHRLLKALDETHVVSQNPVNHRYYIGPLITRLSSRPFNIHQYLVAGAMQEMKRIAEISGETVTVGVLRGIQYIPLHEIASEHGLRVSEEGNRPRRQFIAASTKVLLSQLDDAKLAIAVRHLILNQTTAKTVTDKDVLMSQVREIRKQGYAVSFGEVVVGAACISAPVKDYTIPAVLNIVGPESRIRPAINNLVKELQKSAARISKNMAGLKEPEDKQAGQEVPIEKRPGKHRDRKTGR